MSPKSSKVDRLSLRPAFRLWMENGKRQVVLDQTDAMLLRHIAEKNSLTRAAKETGISYRNAWDRVKAMEEMLGQTLVETRVGGRAGGGAELSKDGIELLKQFRRTRRLLFNILDDRDVWEDISYKLSARNKLSAKIVEVRKGVITSEVKMRLLSPQMLTSIVTNEAIEELSLKSGDDVEAVVKSTDVMLAKKERLGLH